MIVMNSNTQTDSALEPRPAARRDIEDAKFDDSDVEIELSEQEEITEVIIELDDEDELDEEAVVPDMHRLA